MSIEVKNLVKEYGEQKAVNNISFQINKGEIVGFLGPNGAGKSTTMKIITTEIALTITFGNIRGTVYARIDSPSGSRSNESFYNVSMQIGDFLKGILAGGYSAQEVKIIFTKNSDFALESYDIEAITQAAELSEIICE